MADAVPGSGRSNQRRRTRKDLLEAAARLMRDGRAPTLEEIAEEALVSRATAYRYFPGVEALLTEAALHVAFPDPDSLFADGAAGDDPVARLLLASEAVDAMIGANEPALRMMLAEALGRSVRGGGGDDIPARQNRRSPLIRAALEPARARCDAQALERLEQALALVIGTEAMLVFKDVLQLKPEEAKAAREWTIRALAEAALK